MFDRLTKAEKVVAIVGGVITPIGLIIAGAISYGNLQSDVSVLKQEVKDLKRPESPKGALCQTLNEELALALRTQEEYKEEAIQSQMERMGCYEVSAELPASSPSAMAR